MNIARVRARELRDGDEFLTCVTRRHGQARPLGGEFGMNVIMNPIPDVQPTDFLDEKHLHPDVLVDVIAVDAPRRGRRRSHVVRS